RHPEADHFAQSLKRGSRGAARSAGSTTSCLATFPDAPVSKSRPSTIADSVAPVPSPGRGRRRASAGTVLEIAPSAGRRTPSKAIPVQRLGAAGKVSAAKARQPKSGQRVSTWSDAVQSPDQQYELKRRALIQAAARAFNARGYHNTSLDDVAAELVLTRAALYHYIGSKQEILFECHMLAYDCGDLAIAYAREHATNGLETGCLIIRRFIELFNGGMGRVGMMTEHESLEPNMQALIQKRRDEFDHEFRSIIDAGMRDGSIRPVDPKLAVFFTMGAVNWMCTRWYRPDGALSVEEIAASFEDMFRAAMSAGR